MIESIIPTRYDTPYGRFYEHNGILKPSVTNAVSAITKGIGYDKWLGNYSSYEGAMEFAKKAAERGTRTHINCEALIAGLPVLTEGMPKDEALMLMAFKAWVDFAEPKFLASEITMWHPDYPVAGTADIICIIKNQLFLVDIKTGQHYDTHQLQLTGYGELYELVYGKKPELTGLRLSVGRGSTPSYDPKRYEYNHEGLMAAVAAFNWLNPNKPRPFIPVTIPEMIKLEDKYVKESNESNEAAAENRQA